MLGSFIRRVVLSAAMASVGLSAFACEPSSWRLFRQTAQGTDGYVVLAEEARRGDYKAIELLLTNPRYIVQQRYGGEVVCGVDRCQAWVVASITPEERASVDQEIWADLMEVWDVLREDGEQVYLAVRFEVLANYHRPFVDWSSRALTFAAAHPEFEVSRLVKAFDTKFHTPLSFVGKASCSEEFTRRLVAAN